MKLVTGAHGNRIASINKQVGKMRGMGTTSIAQITAALSQLIVVITYSRTLQPMEVGIVAVLLMVQNIGFIIADSGMTNYIIQKKKLTEQEKSTIYLLNLGIGITLFILIFISANRISIFYESPLLVHPLKAISISFIFLPFTIQNQAYLIKNQNFTALAFAEISSRLVSLAVFFFALHINAGIYSVVTYLLTNSILKMLAVHHKGKLYHNPKFSFNFRSLQDVAHFSKFQLSSTFINVSTINLDVFLVGKLLGLEMLGGYSLAKELVFRAYSLINGTIMKVAFPAMAKFPSGSTAQIIEYERTNQIGILANMPIFLFIATASEEIIQALFGQKYISFSPVLSLLAMAYLVRSFTTPRTVLSIANGRPDLELNWNLLSLALQVSALVLGLNISLNIACLSLLVCQILLFVLSQYRLTHMFFKAPLLKPFNSKRMELFLLLSAALFVSYTKSLTANGVLLLDSSSRNFCALVFLAVPYLAVSVIIFKRNRDIFQL